MESTDTHNSAKQLAAHGWPVFPVHSPVCGHCSCGAADCKSVGKHPHTKNGLKSATTDANLLNKWWRTWPDANIGVVTGADSKTIVIDIDPRHGGTESLATLEQEFGELATTVESITGGGGRHLIFKHPGGTIRNRSNVRPGIDVRADGGYIVAPPSMHASGNRYQWREGYAPGEIDCAPLPVWLLVLIQQPIAAKPSSDDPSAPRSSKRDDRLARCLQALLKMKSSDQKDGSKRLFAAACRCVAFDLSADEAVSCVRSYASACPFPKAWSDAQIRARLSDAEKHSQRGKALRERSKGGRSDNGDREPSHAKQLIELAKSAQLWHTLAGDSFATVPVADHQEHYPVRSRAFRQWLDLQFFRATGGAVSGEARQSALSVLEARARFEGKTYPVFVRCAELDSAIYFDLANDDWQAIEVTADSWRIVDNPPVRFKRAKAMLPLPTPVPGGSVEQLRQFINVSDEDYPLVLAWLVAAFCPQGPYPLLNLHGEQGSGKSTQARMLRELTDPNCAPIRAEPKEARDLMIAANNGWVIVLDNLSHVPAWLSDALCRLSTGGGFSTRMLYADDEEIIFDAMRPMILTGIEELASRSDLLDRSLMVTLPTIPEANRRPEKQLWNDFYVARPLIFGALLDSVSAAIRNRSKTSTTHPLPRMADFALWVSAAESALGLASGQFFAAYQGNRESVNDLAIESSPISKPLMELVNANDFEGTATELLNDLATIADQKTCNSKSWPKTPRSLSSALKRLAPNLRAIGVEVETGHRGRGNQKRSTIIIRMTGENRAPTDRSAPTPENCELFGAVGVANQGDGGAMGAQLPDDVSPVPIGIETHGGAGVSSFPALTNTTIRDQVTL
jgi:hypothetical protein